MVEFAAAGLALPEVGDPVGAVYDLWVRDYPGFPNAVCACVSREAWRHGFEEAERLYGPWDAWQTRYDTELSQLDVDGRLDFPPWEQYAAAPLAVALQASRSHPDWGEADPQCGRCRGSGTFCEGWMYVVASRLDVYHEALGDADLSDRDRYSLEFGRAEVPCRFCEEPGPTRWPAIDPCPWCGGTLLIRASDHEGQCTTPVAATLMLFPDGLLTTTMGAPTGRVYSYDVNGFEEARGPQWSREETRQLMLRHPDAVAVFAFLYT